MGHRGRTESGSRHFWSSQVSSIHRSDDSAFYSEKAEEHAAVIARFAAGEPVVDFACGAGELLLPLIDLVPVRQACDFSESMLDSARERIGHERVDLFLADGFEAARRVDQPVWMTCGGLNQYLDPAQLGEWTSLFAADPRSRVLFLFDCVDPHRYRSVRLDSNYREVLNASLLFRAKRHLWRVSNRLQNSHRHHWAYLGRPSMGYGYTPEYFRRLARSLGLDVSFRSSRLYEYRFHAILEKSGVPSTDPQLPAGQEHIDQG